MFKGVLRHIGRQPVAFVALFVALGGGAVAAGTYIKTTDQIPSGDLAGSTYGSPTIASGAVTAAKTNTSSVQSRVIGTCTAGSAVSKVNRNGSVTCGAVQMFGRGTGIDFGTGQSWLVAPTGTSTASSSGSLGEELSSGSPVTIKNLTVRLVNRGISAIDPVPPGPTGGPDGTPGVSLLLADDAGDLGGCTVNIAFSSCSASTVGTLPAGQILNPRLVSDEGVLVGYTPDVVFTYQVVYG
jgi:hypothetical protein